ncbi:MAG: hypothetical protein ABWX94_02870 [Candidatus Saccharimonadales bacterium]
MKKTGRDESRVLIATFIIASTLAFLQLEPEKFDKSFYVILELIITPLLFSSIAAYLFIMTKGATLTNFINLGSCKTIILLERLFYDLAILSYFVSLAALPLLILLVKLWQQFSNEPIPLWPLWVLMGAILITLVFGAAWNLTKMKKSTRH